MILTAVTGATFKFGASGFQLSSKLRFGLTAAPTQAGRAAATGTQCEPEWRRAPAPATGHWHSDTGRLALAAADIQVPRVRLRVGNSRGVSKSDSE